jgi:hypothetical protein
MMHSGVDSVGIDMQPIKDNQPLWTLYYMFFILVGDFFVLNLFVGVVISTFNREKELLGRNFLLTAN